MTSVARGPWATRSPPGAPADPRAQPASRRLGGGVSPLGASLPGGRLGRGVPRGETTAGGKRRDLCLVLLPGRAGGGDRAAHGAALHPLASRVPAGGSRGLERRPTRSALTRAVPSSLTCFVLQRFSFKCLAARVVRARSSALVLFLTKQLLARASPRAARPREAPARRGFSRGAPSSRAAGKARL